MIICDAAPCQVRLDEYSTDEWGFVTDAACRCLFTGKASARGRGGGFSRSGSRISQSGVNCTAGPVLSE